MLFSKGFSFKVRLKVGIMLERVLNVWKQRIPVWPSSSRLSLVDAFNEQFEDIPAEKKNMYKIVHQDIFDTIWSNTDLYIISR